MIDLHHTNDILGLVPVTLEDQLADQLPAAPGPAVALDPYPPDEPTA